MVETDTQIDLCCDTPNARLQFRACGDARAVCTENLNPDVVVMKSAKDRV